MRGAGSLRFAPVGDIVHLDGVAGRKLSERRDLLGMAGLVRYVDHHDGRLAGWAMSALLWVHAASRAAGFGAVAWARRSHEGRRLLADTTAVRSARRFRAATTRGPSPPTSAGRPLKRYGLVRQLAGAAPAGYHDRHVSSE